MIPIVNDLTVGMAMECRRPRGVYLSIDHSGGIEEAFANLGAVAGDIDLILATDAEQILGIGDWGVGGMEAAIGKLAIYTAAAGVDPTRVIPVMLDVGANRENLRDDPAYIGNRRARIRGERYDAFIEAYVTAVTKLFPHAQLQWEDFAPGNGRRILDRYRDRTCTFNDDMQGAGAIQAAYARPASESKTWKRNGDGNGADLAEVVRRIKPTMLIGASIASGSFTEAIVREMAAHTERPIIFAHSNPRALAEASPADLISWTEGRALIATGSPFSPVTWKGMTYAIAQVNNAMFYPGPGPGAIVEGAGRISDGMLAAAANAVSNVVTMRQPGASLLPHIDDLRSVSATVAIAASEGAEAEGLAQVKFDDIVQQARDAVWQPEYRRYTHRESKRLAHNLNAHERNIQSSQDRLRGRSPAPQVRYRHVHHRPAGGCGHSASAKPLFRGFG